MIIPTVAGPFDVTPEIRAGLYVKFKGIDVQNELALMALWLAKNPASHPKLPLRFVENWLRKKQHPNNGGIGSRKVPSSSAATHTPPPSNGAAAQNGPPPTQGLPSLALVQAAAPPNLRLATGARSLADVLGPIKLALKTRGQS